MASAKECLSKSFVYPPLPGPEKGNFIRLVAIEPWPGTVPRRLTLSLLPCIDLDDPPEYEALSYTWNDGTAKNQNITVETPVSGLTSNLCSALLRLQDKNERRLCWIDAICIDQTNVEERNQQVTIMRRIYAQATRVLVWLGDEDETTELAFQKLGRCAYASIEVIGNMRAIFDGHEEDLVAITRLLQRHYFSRLWILQEIIAARNVVVMCGGYLMPWKTLHDAVLWLHACNLRSSLEDEGSIIMALEAWRSELQESSDLDSSNISLLELLSQTRFNEATVDLDRVYSLIGISREAKDPGFTIDYNKDTETVYTETTRLLICSSGNLDVLGLITRNDGRATLPSWVPDFRIPYSAGPLQDRNSGGEARYDASCGQEVLMSSSTSSSHLKLQGKRVDTIRRQYDPLAEFIDPDYQKFLFLPGLLPEMIQKSLGYDPESIYKPTGDSYTQAYLRVLGADLMFSDRVDIFYKMRFFHATMEYMQSKDPKRELTAEIVSEWGNHIVVMTRGRLAIETTDGFLGLAPDDTKTGDVICILSGGHVPFVLRPLDDGMWRLVGECYIHGVMDGEAFEGQKKENLEYFDLV